ncbi:hypothetical protein T03_17815 [Trichinella britovi]|uniref:Uncharacterized protein n=1 Tax=Trichinella britovi TaxID=45882 RepID=A0A0V1CGB8_TRIBR|nr:hypothetical protein T03_17815 [Trichinella britovi]
MSRSDDGNHSVVTTPVHVDKEAFGTRQDKAGGSSYASVVLQWPARLLSKANYSVHSVPKIEKIDESYGGRLASLSKQTFPTVGNVVQMQMAKDQLIHGVNRSRCLRTRSFCSSGGGSRSKRSIASPLAQKEFEVNVKEALPHRYPKLKRNETKHWHF